MLCPEVVVHGKDSEAMWITEARWAAAAERKLGSVHMITSDTRALPQEVLDYLIGSYGIKKIVNPV